ncbi:unnamed protein product, partial [Thlaspi arvense]
RSSVREFVVFVGRTVAKRTPPGQRQSVQHEGPFPNFLLIEIRLSLLSNSGTLVELGFGYGFGP